MTPNPIRKVLSTLRSHHVQFLLMGGQACVFYGAAEFSRDADILLLAEPDNLARLSGALDALKARRIAVPPFEPDYLRRGHAVHFRCECPEAKGIRLDVMSVLRNAPPFAMFWGRRTTVVGESGEHYDMLSLPDLVLAKKTRRDRDWTMLRRLVEANYFPHRDNPTQQQVDFWLEESRTEQILMDVAADHPADADAIEERRPLLEHARTQNLRALKAALREEEDREKEADSAYWSPLIKELEHLRHRRRDEKGETP